MRGIRKRGRLVLAVAAATAALAALTLGTTSSSAAPKADGGNITVWLSGTYAGATPGTTYRKWLDGIKARYEKALPRLEGEVRADADQQRAVHGADRGGVRVEEGARRDAHLLGRLHDAVHAELAAEAQRPVVDKTPGFYASQSAWDLSCLNLDCKGGKGDDLRGPERRRHVRALLQQGAVQEGRDRGAAEDLQGAARPLRQVQGEGHPAARLRRP